MTDLATMLIADDRKEIAKKQLILGISIKNIMESIELDESTVRELQAEINRKSRNRAN